VTLENKEEQNRMKQTKLTSVNKKASPIDGHLAQMHNRQKTYLKNTF
jgi:hypothetical protein